MIFRMKGLVIPAAFVLLSSAQSSFSQTAWFHQWGLLPEGTIDFLIGESSGEKAYNSIIDLSEYNRARTPAEFEGTLFETEYIAEKLREYGLSEVGIERFGKTTSYRAVKGELWEVGPRPDKIADIADLPFVLIPGSPNTETVGDLVYIGEAYTGDLDRMDLAGKIVLTSARPGAIINMMLQKSVAGIVSYYSPRPTDDPDIIPDMKGWGISRGRQASVASFNISPREGEVLVRRIMEGEKIRVRMSVRFRTEEFDIQVVSASIPGSEPDAGEIVVSAHLFEGYGVQGANDNLSGSAAILEAARVINRLISEGKIKQPRRTIRFIWVPEFSGTIPWVNKHMDRIRKTLCNVNLDMVGLSLSRYRSFFILHRTPGGRAHYINDVLENYYRYVGETNQVNSVITGSRFFKPIVAPSGTYDPFYYQIESPSTGSDHEVFNDWGVGVPAVLLITWPDPFYHTSEDRADKCDPTQLKRVVFITAASAYTIAEAGENEAVNIAGEVYGNSIRRIGYQVSRAFDRINKTGADELLQVLRRSIGEVRGTLSIETSTLNTVTQLAPESQVLRQILRDKAASLEVFAESVIASLEQTAVLRAKEFGMPPVEIQPSSLERRAMNMVPVIVKDPRDLGYEGYIASLNDLSAEVKSRYPVTGVPDPAEATACINGNRSILVIKGILDAQSPIETSLEGLINYFSRLREAGFIKF